MERAPEGALVLRVLQLRWIYSYCDCSYVLPLFDPDPPGGSEYLHSSVA